MSTSRLYYHDSYRRQFSATVVDQADDGRRIYLDQTLFYPTSGGQPFDTGTLGGVRVLDVVDEEERIAHLLERPLAAGRVEGEIDWPRRYDFMQQHTAQHLLSAIFEDRFRLPTVSVHFGPESSTLDLEVAELAESVLREAEATANRIVAENRPVLVTFEDAATAAGLRKAPARSGEIRVVSIHEVDRSACGGTHLRGTAEAGPIIIRRVERVKKLSRLEFVAGERAVARARRDHALLSGVAGQLSAGIEEVPALVDKLRTDLRAAEASRRDLDATLQGYRARELYHQAAPDPSGRRTVVLASSPDSMETLRQLAQALVELPNVLLVATLGAPPAILFATSADTGIDAGQRLKPLLTAVGGRGGGGARVAQGTAPSKDLLAGVAAELAR